MQIQVIFNLGLMPLIGFLTLCLQFSCLQLHLQNFRLGIFKISRRIIWRDTIFPKDFWVCYKYRRTSNTNEHWGGERFLKVNSNSDKDCNLIQMLRAPREKRDHVELSLDSRECGNMTSHAKTCGKKQSSTANCLAGRVLFL